MELLLSEWLIHLKSLSLPGSSIIICDNYILSDARYIESNLFKILKALLPEKKHKKAVDITIVTKQFYRKPGTPPDLHQEEELSKVYQRVRKYIIDNLGLINFNLTLIKTELSRYHDRQIFTNTCVYEAGNSFNFFNQKNKIRLHSITDFKIIPLTAEKQDKEQQKATYAEYYQDHLCEIHQIVEKVRISRCQGNKRNRLLNGFRVAGQ